MFKTAILKCVRKPSSTLDYAKHMPKDYVERMKRTIPKKIYSNRLGAPDITRWEYVLLKFYIFTILKITARRLCANSRKSLVTRSPSGESFSCQ